MKLVVITALNEYEEQLSQLLAKLQVPVYSRLDIEGHKSDANKAAVSNWFGASRDNVESMMFFSFTEKEKAEAILKAIQEENDKQAGANPVRAFVMNVENHV